MAHKERDDDRKLEEHSTTKSTEHDEKTEQELKHARDESVEPGETRQSNRNRDRVDRL